MITPADTNPNVPTRGSQTSLGTTSDIPTRTWHPPKAPLPPHRLAKLANALGVALPVPNHSSALPSRSWSESGPSDIHRRPPTPSTATLSSFTSPSTTSRFFLHVLPPLSFLYDLGSSEDNDLLPPPSNASGYHTQFRRGVLVPVHSSFQSQLSAIAKEYALPSTAGLILYLITTSISKGSSHLSPNILHDEGQDEPGPRLSDEIWKLLWKRVMQVEQHDEGVTPGLVGARMNLASRSTPHLLDTATSSPRLRPLISTPVVENHQPLSSGQNTLPSTPSSGSDLRSNFKSVADSPVDREEPGTPDTSATSNVSLDAQQQAQSFDLPGLRSPSLIPILAKVEFDIDRRKAAWYDPWLRSRRANHAKRAESRSSRKGSISRERPSHSQERHPPIQLIIGRQQSTSPTSIVVPAANEGLPKGRGRQECGDDELEDQEQGVASSGYQRLSESNDLGDEDAGSDGAGSDDDDEPTARVVAVGGKDPLADVFGTDGDAWADIRAANSGRKTSHPSTVNLALTAADLNGLSDELDGPDTGIQPEEDEVRELLDQLSPTLGRSPPPMHPAKKRVPPPLSLVLNDRSKDLVVPAEPSPMPSSASSAGLAYLNGSSAEKSPSREFINPEEGGEEELDDRYNRVRSPAESEKRAGTFYDDLDLGLDPTEEFDEDDPNDRRRSQLLLKAQLDEIERTMAQLSPRVLNSGLEEQSLVSASLSSKSLNSAPLSPRSETSNPDRHTPSVHGPVELAVGPPRSSSHPELVHGPPRTSSQQAWPAVPFASIRDSQTLGTNTRTDGPPSPPRLALNGVTTSAPKSFVPTPKASPNAVSAETEHRKRELEEEYPTLANSASPLPNSTAESPIIPLSPDPFGRYPSTPDLSANPRLSNSSIHQWDAVTIARGSISLEPVAEDVVPSAPQGRSRSATTSRFSADSITGVDTASIKPSMRTTLMTVKSIKKLWRKSNNKSNSNNNVTGSSGRNSPQVLPIRPERPSQETMDLPDVEPPLPGPSNFKGYSPHPNPHLPPPAHRTSQDKHNRPRTSQDQYNPSRISHDQMNGPSTQNLIVPQSKQGIQVPSSFNPGPQSSAPNQGLAVPVPNPGPAVPPQTTGLSAPPFVGRAMNPSPIIAAQMLPGRGGSALDKLHFDQESPYPVRVSNAPRHSPRLASPPPLPPVQLQGLPMVPEKEKPTARKSILKAFQRATGTGPLPSPSEPQPGLDRQGSNGRPRRPSFHSTKGSVASSITDIPPSPRIPEHLIGVNANGRNGTAAYDTQESVRSRLTMSSTESAFSRQKHLGRASSPPRSMASSRDSQETRPSFDVSQFEIVSPKTSTLTYPYHGLDQ